MIRGTKLDTNIKENNTPRKIEKNKDNSFRMQKKQSIYIEKRGSADGYGRIQRNQDKVKYRAIKNI